MFAVNFIC